MEEELQINILEDIGGWGFTLNSLLRQLRGKRNVKKLKIPINTYGGFVTDGMAIYNTLRGRPEKVETMVVGYAMSMGSILLMAGDHRSMPENGYVMIHNPWSMAIGDVNDMENEANTLGMLTKDLASVYVRATGLEEKVILDMMERETWMNGAEALRLGFVDEVTDGVEFKAEFNKEWMAKLMNVPAALIGNNKKSIIMDFTKLKKSLGKVSKSITDFVNEVEEEEDVNLDDFSG